MHLTTLLSEIFCFCDFFVTGRDGTDKRTDIGTDTLFLENIILDSYFDQKIKEINHKSNVEKDEKLQKPLVELRAKMFLACYFRKHLEPPPLCLLIYNVNGPLE